MQWTIPMPCCDRPKLQLCHPRHSSHPAIAFSFYLPLFSSDKRALAGMMWEEHWQPLFPAPPLRGPVMTIWVIFWRDSSETRAVPRFGSFSPLCTRSLAWASYTGSRAENYKATIPIHKDIRSMLPWEVKLSTNNTFAYEKCKIKEQEMWPLDTTALKLKHL